MLGTTGSPQTGSSNFETCLTDDCRITAAEILRNMDSNVAPCTNFYEFACGNYKTRIDLSTVDDHYNRFKEIEITVSHRLRDIIYEPITARDAEAVKKVKKAFHVCMDEERIDQMGMAEIKSILAKKGGWPIVTSSRKEGTAVPWYELDKWYISIMGESAFFRFNIEPDSIDPTKHAFVLMPSLSTLPTNVLQKSSHHQGKMDTYRKFIVDVAEQFLEETSIWDANKVQDVKDIMDLEIALARIKHVERLGSRMIPPEKKRFIMSEFVRSQKMRQRSKPQAKIDWKSILQSFLANSDLMYDPAWKMIVYDLPYFQQLEKVLSEVPAKVIVNYIHWQFIRRLLGSINSALEFLDYQLRSGTLKKKPNSERWMECLNSSPAQLAIIHRYLEKHVPLKSERMIKEMIKDVKKELEHQIGGASWLDRKGKDASQLKITHLNEFIGPPLWLRNATLINEYYGTLSIGDSHFRNILNQRMYDVRNTLNLLAVPVNRLADSVIWPYGIAKVNAYYNRRLNALIIPLGVMQPPFFMNDTPENVQFGALGTAIGHELTHGFDETGRRYAHDGSRMMWSSKSAEAFRKRAQCWIDQFNEYTYKELEEFGRTVHCDGAATESENMADSVGMQLAYAAFKARKKDYQKLPGLSTYTDDQLFFLSYANMWCEYRDLDSLMYFSEISKEHSIGEHRVIGAVSNMKSFSDAFQCSKDSPMNRKRRCSLWK
ncbi:membrane metallo-endopeptidase-like 1 isoform X2 [Orussus abietinus]|nr:membrane metallo-endopeptidase-like 1 isoform X2 [Orussus abietinus]